jgi:hypothetical protein
VKADFLEESQCTPRFFGVQPVSVLAVNASDSAAPDLGHSLKSNLLKFDCFKFSESNGAFKDALLEAVNCHENAVVSSFLCSNTTLTMLGSPGAGLILSPMTQTKAVVMSDYLYAVDDDQVPEVCEINVTGNEFDV